MRAQFVMSEIGIGLRRNLTMTVAVIVSVALSLALAGAAILLRTQVDQMRGYWSSKVEVSIYLCNKPDSKNPEYKGCAGGPVTDAQKAQIQAQLMKTGEVEKIYTETQQQAYDNFKSQQPNNPLIPMISPSNMNDSFRVKLKNPQHYAIITSLVSDTPGVKQVVDENEVLKPLFKLLNGAQFTAIIIMVIMLGVTLLLIVNTVRVSAFSRKRETGIMRLVGASNYYVQMPFIAEAAFAATVGAVLASGMLMVGKYLLIDQFLAKQITLFNFIGWGPVFKVMPLLLVIGIAMSSAAAFLTLRKYLKV
ncbi:permease-like cell division protein FtsX [Streptacidiphilus monticola]|uniref:Cell division protein FtsX n=1 Tax=Streptacidiphilus monticola TaxID=2161674 RepID=A0ABW1FXP0_9ACTN